MNHVDISLRKEMLTLNTSKSNKKFCGMCQNKLVNPITSQTII